MSPTRARAAGLSLALTLALVSGCGGGFNNKAPERPATPVTYTHYAALGDGFASAPYLGRDTSGTDCLRSANNYRPRSLAPSRSAPSPTSPAWERRPRA